VLGSRRRSSGDQQPGSPQMKMNQVKMARRRRWRPQAANRHRRNCASSVRPGSVPQPSTMGVSGHKRSLTVQTNRRSATSRADAEAQVLQGTDQR
jgi:hypothetical protein